MTLLRQLFRFVVLLTVLSTVKVGAGQTKSPSPSPVPSGKAPWMQGDGSSPAEQPAGMHASPRSLFVSVEDSHLRQLQDGVPLDTDEEETLLRVLLRTPVIDLGLVDVYCRQTQDVEWSTLAAQPEKHRLEFYRLRGSVQQVTEVRVLQEVAARFGVESYYRVKMALQNSPYQAMVYALRIPQAWRSEPSADEPLDEPSRVDAVFLKAGPKGQLVLAADRMEWLPARPHREHGVADDQVLLAQLGMDIGLFEDIADRDGKEGIGVADRKCFYQLLHAVGNAKNADLTRRCKRPFDLIELLKNPRPTHGNLYLVEAVARRITRIEVNEKDIRQRWGIDHYYQIDAFVDIGRRAVQLVKSRSKSGDQNAAQETGKEKGAPILRNQYPITICVRRLPPELAPPNKTRVQDKLQRRIRLPVFHFRIWSYQSGFTSQFDPQQRQPSPMFIGLSPQTVETSQAMSPLIGVAIGALFIIALGAAWIGLWRSHRSDERFTKTKLRRRLELKKGESLNQLNIEE